MDCSLSGSSVHGISRQEYWRGLPFSSPGDLLDPGMANAGLLCWQVGSSPLHHLGTIFITHPEISGFRIPFDTEMLLSLRETRRQG